MELQGIDIIVDDVKLSDVLATLKGTLRVTDIPLANTAEQEITYAEQSNFVDGQRFLGSAVRSASRTLTITMYADVVTLNAAVQIINDFFFFKNSKKIKFGNDASRYWLGRSNSLFAPTIPGEGTTASVTGNVTLQFDDPKSFGENRTVIKSNLPSDDVEVIHNGNSEVSIEFHNKGETVEPEISITNKSDGGYVSIATESNAFAFGNEKALDGRMSTIINSRTNQDLETLFAIGEKGVTINVEKSETSTHGLVLDRSDNLNGSYGLRPDGNSLSGITIDLKDDLDTKSEYVWWRQIFWAGRENQSGTLKILFSDQNNKLLYGVETYKRNHGFSTEYNFIAGRADGSYEILDRKYFKPSHSDSDNPFNPKSGWSDIVREENTLSFYWRGSRLKKSRDYLEGRRATKLHIVIGPSFASSDLVTHQIVQQIIFRRTDQPKMEEVQNLFKSGSILKIDCLKKDIYLDGIKRISELVDGGRFPVISKGKNKWIFNFNSWIEQRPEIEISYKERRY